jgi:hypothetical protein
VRLPYDTPKKPAFKGSLSGNEGLIAETQTPAISIKTELEIN